MTNRRLFLSGRDADVGRPLIRTERELSAARGFLLPWPRVVSGRLELSHGRGLLTNDRSCRRFDLSRSVGKLSDGGLCLSRSVGELADGGLLLANGGTDIISKASGGFPLSRRVGELSDRRLSLSGSVGELADGRFFLSDDMSQRRFRLSRSIGKLTDSGFLLSHGG